MLHGLIPLVKTYINKLPNVGTRKEREILGSILKSLRSTQKKGKLNAFDVFKRDYM